MFVCLSCQYLSAGESQKTSVLYFTHYTLYFPTFNRMRTRINKVNFKLISSVTQELSREREGGDRCIVETQNLH